jgi:hypothetical protein
MQIFRINILTVFFIHAHEEILVLVLIKNKA